jgi:hypothetical protein
MDRVNRLASILINGAYRVTANAPYPLSQEEYLKANRAMGLLGMLGALNANKGADLEKDEEIIRKYQAHTSGETPEGRAIRYLLENYIDKGKPLPRKRWVSGSHRASERNGDLRKANIEAEEDSLLYKCKQIVADLRSLTMKRGDINVSELEQLFGDIDEIEEYVWREASGGENQKSYGVIKKLLYNIDQNIEELDDVIHAGSTDQIEQIAPRHLDRILSVFRRILEMVQAERVSSRELGRIAQSVDELEYRPHERVRPPITEVDPTAKIYRDTDDLEDDEDEDLDERGDKSVLLFGGDDDDYPDFDEGDAEVGKETLRKSRLKLIAGMIWAQLGEADAVVEESAPNELSVRVQDLSWKVTVDDDGKVTISGFDSGAEQFVGEIPEEDAEAEIVKIADHVHQLIAEDIDEKSTPAEPPVHFGPEDTGVEEEEMGGGEEAPPVAPQGDQGAATEETALPPDLAAPAGGEMPFGAAPQAPPPAPAPGGMSPMGAVPPAAPQAPGAAPGPAPFPAASRRRIVLPSQVRRVAFARLETVSNELESIGEALGDDGEEVFGNLAERVRSMVDWIE